MTDGQGRTVDFKNTVIVMDLESGLAQDPADDRRGRGEALDQDRRARRGQVKLPAGVREPDRRDRRVPSAGRIQIAEIAKIQLKALEARLAKLEIRLSVSDAALQRSRRRGSIRSTARGR